MSMTNEEAKKHIVTWFYSLEDYELPPLQVTQALQVAISALRPITREQVEETKAVFFQPGVEDVAQDSYRCSHCYVQEFGDTRGINFCPHCGAPMTDEAVEILAKRMEEIRSV